MKVGNVLLFFERRYMKLLTKHLYLVTIIFFTLSFINITFSLFGLICLIYPLIDYKLSKRKSWCLYYCPRRSVFTKLVSKLSFRRRIPEFFLSKHMKQIIIYYFGINLFFATMSTFMVAIGKIDVIDQFRFLIVFEVTDNLYQFITFDIHPALLHFSYRVFSMITSSLIVGVIFGVIFKPLTWCVFCPVKTIITPGSLQSTNKV